LKHRLPIIGLGMILALAAPLVLAQESHVSRDGSSWTQETTGTLSGCKNLRVRIDMGSVVVRGGSQQQIDYVVRTKSRTGSEQEARRQLDSYKVTAWVKGDTAWIVGDWQGKSSHSNHISGEFRINIPREMALVKIETDGGNVDASGIAGKLEAESGGGSMRFDDIGAGINGETGGGSISVGAMTGDLALHTGGGSVQVRQAKGKVVVETGGGSVDIQSGAQGAVIETGGGSIHIRQCAGKLKASTGGGTIDAGDVDGPADIETSGGNIRLSSAKGPVRAETGGGGIELGEVPSAQAETGAGPIVVKLVNTGAERRDSELETSAGDVTLYIAPDVAVNVFANVELASGHKITSDFSEIQVRSEGDWGEKTISAEGKLNGGGPVVKVRTTTGDICIRRLNR
jgi:DUF4097 and DUF4098 domain-containing protein YvlB